jgi:hypothetical protein
MGIWEKAFYGDYLPIELARYAPIKQAIATNIFNNVLSI